MTTENSPGTIRIAEGLWCDDQGLAIDVPFRPQRIGWAEVRRFTDGSTDSDWHWKGGLWALAVVLHDGQTVIAAGTAAKAAPSKTLVAIGQAAQRYGIPAELTGSIERGSFPPTLAGPAGTIRVTIRDLRAGNEAAGARRAGDDDGTIVEVVQRTEPVQKGDILALSHDGTDVEVLEVRQIFAGGAWEQVVYVHDVL
jgi:hypothetical protein